VLLPLLLGFLLDQLLGDPPRWPHPVRWIGWLIGRLEGILRPRFSPRCAGVFLLILVLLVVAAVVSALLALGAWCHPWVETAVATVLSTWFAVVLGQRVCPIDWPWGRLALLFGLMAVGAIGAQVVTLAPYGLDLTVRVLVAIVFVGVGAELGYLSAPMQFLRARLGRAA